MWSKTHIAMHVAPKKHFFKIIASENLLKILKTFSLILVVTSQSWTYDCMYIATTIIRLKRVNWKLRPKSIYILHIQLDSNFNTSKAATLKHNFPMIISHTFTIYGKSHFIVVLHYIVISSNNNKCVPHEVCSRWNKKS